MKVVLALARKELRLLLRDRMAAGLLVGMPLLFNLMLGLLQKLQGLVRCRLGELSPAARQRLADIPGCTLRDTADGELELHGSDVKGMLIRLIAILNEANVELIHLETEEPNLERVFLHLTGRALRD